MTAAIRRGALALFLVTSAATWAVAADPSPVGLWDATIVVGTNKFVVPFKFEISGAGRDVTGFFFDGDQKVPSTEGHYENGALTLVYPQFGARLEATWDGDRLVGKYDRGTRGVVYPFAAARARPTPASTAAVPSIAGEWRIALPKDSEKGETSWRLVIRQTGQRVTAAIMRVDGDSGALTGPFRNGTFFLSHFPGTGPTTLEITPAPDGSLRLVEDGANKLTAVRVNDARAKAIAEPTDPHTYTSVKNPSEKFRFRFPDVDGKIVADTDARFQGKVVIVSVTGTWCPNCHDEAPFLAGLYRSHRARGLEIVALSFEEPEQLKDLTRVRGFIKQYGIAYPFLIAGQPEEAPDKIPQAVNLNTFPATFVLGRDGRVRAVHAGYASKATGDFYTKEQQQFVAEIDRLLAEKAPAASR